MFLSCLRFWCRVAVLSVLVTFANSVVKGQSFIKDEVTNSHKNLNERYARFSGQLSFATEPGSMRNASRNEVFFETTADYPRVLHFSTSRRGKAVHGINPSYYFHLTMNDSEQWEIENVIKIDDRWLGDWPLVNTQESDDVRRRTAGQLIRTGFLGFHVIGGIEVARLFELPEFRVLELREKTVDSVRKIELTYSYEPKTPLDRVTIRSGKIVFLPDSYWVVERAEVFGAIPQVDDDRWLTIVENTFTFSEGFPIIQRSTHAIADAGNPQNVRFTHVFEYNISETTETSPKFYTLSNFGFPEPDFGERRAGPVRYFLMAIGVLMVAFALWRMYLGHRKNKI